MGTLYSLYDKAGGRVLDLGKWGSVLTSLGPDSGPELRLGGEVTVARLEELLSMAICAEHMGAVLGSTLTAEPAAHLELLAGLTGVVASVSKAHQQVLAAVRDWIRLSAGPVTYWADDHDEPWRDDRTQEPLHGLRLWSLTGPGGRGDSGDWRPWPSAVP